MNIADFISRPADPIALCQLGDCPATGVYVLEMQLTRRKKTSVGALGTLTFSRGTYLYVGSAKAHLPHRLARHFACQKKLKWHIDYLTALTPPLRAVVWPWAKGRECELADRLSSISRAVRGFGCSDCNCEAHLFRLRRPSRLWWLDCAEVPTPECVVRGQNTTT